MPVGISYLIGSEGSLLRQVLMIQIITGLIACFLILITNYTSVYRISSVYTNSNNNQNNNHLIQSLKPSSTPYTIISTIYSKDEKDDVIILNFEQWMQSISRLNLVQSSPTTSWIFPEVLIFHTSVSANYTSFFSIHSEKNSNRSNKKEDSPFLLLPELVQSPKVLKAFVDDIIDGDFDIVKKNIEKEEQQHKYDLLVLAIMIEAITNHRVSSSSSILSIYHHHHDTIIKSNNINENIILWVHPYVTMTNGHLLRVLPDMVRRNNGLWLPSSSNNICKTTLFGFDASNQTVVNSILIELYTTCLL
ncbi:hypothetical protein BDC45DRAFT_516444 [Circinella umbellata]|nr:hypothetical protein BDC45DRAFT_516444 [Circinella umbellata]